MLGMAYLRADTCSGCGKSLTVTAAPGADARDWLVTRHTCTACEMLAIQQKALDTKEHPHTSAYVWTAERT